MNIRKILLIFFIVGGEFIASATIKKQVSLVQNGVTDYQIVVSTQLNSIDKFAVDELRKFLKLSTGADFKVLQDASQIITGLNHRIFVGLSPTAIEILKNNPSAGLNDQEHVVRSMGDDIFLFGKGEYGNLYAVYSFLENQVGCRWYTPYGDMKIPRHFTLVLDSFDYKRKFAFPLRGVMNFFYNDRIASYLFCYRNFQNIMLHNALNLKLSGVKAVYEEIDPVTHTAFSYMPPGGPILSGSGPPLPWLENENFFDTNPDFFSMDENGKRVNNRQLCFSNPNLRKKLTEHIEKRLKEFDGKGVITIDANDNENKFCCCSSCTELEKKYKTPGGPLVDYLIEACAHIKDKYPEAYIKTLAYHKTQMEIPPASIVKLPENLIVIFAPIDDNFLAGFPHPSNANTYNNLKKWCSISKHVWIWYYPNPYNLDSVVPPLPFGNLKRIIEDIKLIKEAGAEGTYFEHDSGVPLSANFSDLQTWLMLKLFQDPNQDASILIKEFTDYYYGDASLLMRQYISELELCREQLLDAGKFWRFSTQMGQYEYLTPENIMKWERMFDKMEILTEKEPDQQFHVRLARMTLDLSAVLRSKPLINKYPEIETSLHKIESRLKTTYQQMVVQRLPGDRKDISPWLERFKDQPK